MYNKIIIALICLSVFFNIYLFNSKPKNEVKKIPFQSSFIQLKLTGIEKSETTYDIYYEIEFSDSLENLMEKDAVNFEDLVIIPEMHFSDEPYQENIVIDEDNTVSETNGIKGNKENIVYNKNQYVSSIKFNKFTKEEKDNIDQYLKGEKQLKYKQIRFNLNQNNREVNIYECIIES